MTRRSHVVRTDDQGPIATPRAIGGCEIFCATQDNGGGPALMSSSGVAASIAVTSSRNYQRCFVSATIDDIYVQVPDPPPVPGPGAWTVRFECPVTVANSWKSTSYFPPPNTTLSKISWAHTGSEPVISGTQFAWLQEEDDYNPFYPFKETSGTELVGTVPMQSEIWLAVSWTYGPMWAEMTLSSPQGEFTDDVTITDGVDG